MDPPSDGGRGRDEGPRIDDSSPTARVTKLAAQENAGTRYVLKGELARGGMGAILEVFDTDLRRNLAMKVILSQETSGAQPVDSKMLGRFLEEAQVTGQLEHPGVVPVHELGIDGDGRTYFTMRLVRGEDLKRVFERVHAGDPEWTLTRALGVLLKVCETMACAHDKGVVHRDLKPANVMVGRYGEVYVMDWGLARVEGQEDLHDLRLRAEAGLSVSAVQTDRKETREAGHDSPLVTMDGDVVGTPHYMPPEQACGRLADVGPRSDVYALGAMLYDLLTGHVPYHVSGGRPSPHTVLAMVLQGPPQAVHESRSDVPPELEAICEKAMAREAGERYANMGELAGDLRAFLESRVVRAYRTGAVAEFKKWVRRNRGIATLGATVLALVLVGGYTLPTFLNARLERLRNEEASTLALLDLNRPLAEREESRVRDAVDRIARRVLAGDSNEEDRRRFVSATLELSFEGERYLRAGESVLRLESRRRVPTSTRLACSQRVRLRLDGEAYELQERERAAFMLLPMSSMLASYLRMDLRELGLHVVDGEVEVQLVRLPTSNSTALSQLLAAAREAGEEPLSWLDDPLAAPITVPLASRHLLVLEDPPEQRPVLVREAFLEERFQRESSLEWLSSSEGGAFEVSLRLPLPDVWLPVTVQVTTPRGPLDGSANATMGAAGSLRIVAMDQSLPLHLLLGPDRIGGVVLRDGGHHVESVSWSPFARAELDALQLRIHVEPTTPLERGERVGIRISPAEELLLELDLVSDAGEYARVAWEGTAER